MEHPLNANRQLIIAVDFDGTLVEHVFPGMGAPRMETIELVKQLKRRGHALILWTCRAGEALEDAVRFCASMGIQLDAVNKSLPNPDYPFPDSPKVYADVYLDDKAFNVSTFDQLRAC